MKKRRASPISTSNPIVFVSGKYAHTKENVSQQLMLLRALNVAEDPKKFKQIIRARAAVDVFRTLDKISLRKEWHNALERNGVDFDLVLGVLKTEMLNGDKSSDRIAAAKVIIKSLGLDKYEDSSLSGGSWEDEILRIAGQGVEGVEPGQVYDVVQPKVPESARKKREEQDDMGKSLYE
jgi:hypothetical protein